MSKKPGKSETNLVGSWIEKDGFVVQDAVCKRIQWLIDFYFQQIAVDGDNWTALYKNPDDNSYWELIYPQSHMHGGGPPTLQRISEDDVHKRYSLGSKE